MISTPPTLYFAPGIGGAVPDGQLTTLGLGPGELSPDAGRAMIATSNVLYGGGSAYIGGDPGPAAQESTEDHHSLAIQDHRPTPLPARRVPSRK